MTKKATTQDYLVVGVILLLGFTILNFSADWIYRGAQIELNTSIQEAFTTQANINNNQTKINILIAEVLGQLDKDIRSNMKVIDQLTGLLLRGDF